MQIVKTCDQKRCASNETIDHLRNNNLKKGGKTYVFGFLSVAWSYFKVSRYVYYLFSSINYVFSLTHPSV